LFEYIYSITGIIFGYIGRKSYGFIHFSYLIVGFLPFSLLIILGFVVRLPII